MRDECFSVRESEFVTYWVAWRESDNPDAGKYPLLFRLFRDDVRKGKAEALTEPMSREEAEVQLNNIKLLIGA